MTHTFYNATSGDLMHVIQVSKADLAANTPANAIRIEGDYRDCDAIDLETRVPYKKTAPALSLSEVKAQKKAELKRTCQDRIESGFISNALGAAHTYDSALKDQVNITGAAYGNADVNYTCTDSAGVKAPRWHTANQALQVFWSWRGHLVWHRAHYYELLAKVDAATDEAALAGIDY